METNNKIREIMLADALNRVKARTLLKDITKKDDYFELVEFLIMARDGLSILIKQAKDGWSDEREKREKE